MGCRTMKYKLFEVRDRHKNLLFYKARTDIISHNFIPLNQIDPGMEPRSLFQK